jgi:4-oxalocrotonate tautomerase
VNGNGRINRRNVMPIVRIEMLSGRNAAQKARLAEAITKAMVEIAKAKPEDTNIVFADVSRADWAVAGKLISDT